MTPEVVPEIDPVTFEVILHRLLAIAEEMGIKYMRTSGSPILVGAYDASTGITLPNGDLVALGPYITTQGNVLPIIVRSVLEKSTRNPGIHAGDMFVCNDPYLGATHQPDVATVAPVFYDGTLLSWVGSSGHWIDIGGPEPGGFNMSAKSVYDEGLRMPPTRIVDAGYVREDLVGLIMNQVRDPLCELDLRGQLVANSTGVGRMESLYDHYGPATVQAAMHKTIDYVERRLRARLLELPDGTWQETQFLDQDGHQSKLYRITCTLTKTEDHLLVDFTGTDPQAEGFINCTLSGVRAATISAIYIALAYDLPWNDGVARCLELIVPPGTVVSAIEPAPVSMSTISSIIVSLNLVFGALSKMLLASPDLREEAMANWCGTSLAPTVTGYNDRGFLTVFGETSHFAAGCGARVDRDGVDTGGIIINTTASIPSVEASEAEYPILYLFRQQLIDSGGPGRFRGGVSAGVAIIPYHSRGLLHSSFAGCGTETANAYGLAGGLPGAAVRYIRFEGSRTEERIRDGVPLPTDIKDIDGEPHITCGYQSHAPFPPDMVEYHNWQGGGGYGDPVDREAGAVLRDVRQGLVSETSAREIYGVVMTELGLDSAATEQLRAEIRTARIAHSRPASEILTDGAAIGLNPVVPPQAQTRLLRYGDFVEFDFEADQARCLRCDTVLGSAFADFRAGCRYQEMPMEAAGPVRGQDYNTERMRLRLYVCPGCGTQLEAEVGVVNAPGAGLRLRPIP